jgi:hypothetical protein
VNLDCFMPGPIPGPESHAGSHIPARHRLDLAGPQSARCSIMIGVYPGLPGGLVTVTTASAVAPRARGPQAQARGRGRAALSRASAARQSS